MNYKRKIKFPLLLIFLLLSVNGISQPPEVTYQGTVAKAGWDYNKAYGPFSIGFPFTYFGNTYNDFYIGSNGYVSFGAGYTSNVSAPIPTAATPNNMIAAFWDYLDIDPSGSIMYTTVGASPNRKLIVQFRNMGFYLGPVYFGTFYVILYENTNNIQVQYRQIVLPYSTKSHGTTATIGIENSDGSAGVQYSNHTASITDEQAILFTPSGSTYTFDANADYGGVYLTSNLTLPEPGITTLTIPSGDATIGSSQTFQWNESTDATNYSLKISTNSTLSGATSYNAGTNLSYDISGLTVPATYYWGVFASNSTGTTWCEIRRFYTSAIPSLIPISEAVWTEQGQDKTITLNYTGGDASPKTAIITLLPTQGQLYQYNSGSRGSIISSVPTTITDPGRNVIYAATGTAGNGVGNFNFKMNDANGDSPDGTITVNVSPPGIPNVLYLAKSTTYVEIQLDRIMADPTGKQSQFEVKVNGTSVTINSVSLKTGDAYTLILNLASTLSGSETVLASYAQGDVQSSIGGYLLSFADQPVTLTAQTITFSQSLTKKYNESPVTLTASASSGLGMTYSSSNASVATVSSNILTLTGIGSSIITARQAGNGTYAPVKYTKTLTVSKGDQTITFGVLPVKTYGDADFTVTATSSSGLSVSFASDNPAVATVAGNLIHIVGAGTDTITASQTGNALWNAATIVRRALIVNMANQSITFNILSVKTYGDVDFSPGATASSGLTVSYTSDNPAVATIVAGLIHITGVGTAVITASQAGNSNYNPAADVPQTLTVNKAILTITADSKTKTYGAANPALTFHYSGWKYTDDSTKLITLPTSGTTVDLTTSVGVYTNAITVAGGSSNNYTFSYVAASFTVNKATLTVTAYARTKTYGAANPPLTFRYSGWQNGEDSTYLTSFPTASTTVTILSPVAIYSNAITVAGGSSNNYTFSYVAASFTVNKATLTVTADAKTKTYGAANPALTFQYSGWQNGDNVADLATVPIATTTVTVLSPVAIYNNAITVSGGADDNYAFTCVPADFTVTKAMLTVTADTKTKTYGASNPALTFQYSGWQNADNEADLATVPIATTTVTILSPVAIYNNAITVSGGADNNYDFTYVPADFTVTKAMLTVTTDTKTKTYGASNPTLTFQYSGWKNADNEADLTTVPIATTTVSALSPVGTYANAITLSGGADDNYDFTYVPADFIVSKTDLTFTAEDKTKVFGQPNPDLTYIISGFVNGETQTVLDALPSIQTTALLNSPVGTYPITISGGSDNNYNYVFVDGTLTITRYLQTITFTDIPERLLVGDSYTLVASSTSGLTVSFESLDPQVATVEGNLITGISKGNARIRAYNPGDINYEPAEVIDTVEVYSTHKDIMYLFTPNGDGFNDYWELPKLQDWGKCDVKVYNRWGKLVYANPDYNNLWDGTSDGNPVPEGAYYFIIKTENSGIVKGTVNIVR